MKVTRNTARSALMSDAAPKDQRLQDGGADPLGAPRPAAIGANTSPSPSKPGVVSRPRMSLRWT
jgi:hypothetical protein